MSISTVIKKRKIEDLFFVCILNASRQTLAHCSNNLYITEIKVLIYTRCTFNNPTAIAHEQKLHMYSPLCVQSISLNMLAKHQTISICLCNTHAGAIAVVVQPRLTQLSCLASHIAYAHKEESYLSNAVLALDTRQSQIPAPIMRKFYMFDL